MSTTPTSTPIRPGDNVREQLKALRVPDAQAERWAAMGPAMSATLWTFNGHALLEAHRATSAHRTIVDACLLDGGDAGARAIESAQSWEVLIQAVLDAAPGAPLAKAATRDEGSVFEKALGSRGFTAAGVVGSPLSIEEDPDHGHASVRGWVRWNARPEAIPAYVRQKTDFTCGPASALMALAHASGGAPHEVSHGLRDEMELWRESTYSLGVGPYGLAAALARRGQSVEVVVTHEGPIVGLTRAHAASPAVRRAIHHQHVDEARALGVWDRIAALGLEDLRFAVQRGNGVIVLVDLADLNGEQTPHWVYVWGIVGEHALIHDPWNDEQFGETWVETWSEAITLEQLWESAQWEEEERARACIIVHL
ncbi:peptidase C39 family protein [Schaalia odontolytica]|uniref:Domain of uncharacterized function (DUF3335) n=1 Tax=Schaalia odontolytica TaxID=1660 RepID=A0A2X0UGN6_9ACTO|nr:peptidase C39 family protein [Schaalia odontolytica]WMS27650.1 peptidase C39 family protein [Schaalia odontolytica]SPT54820.1 Domain of uncharacterised function (DUF3335) [Schaalia odontolytica]